MQKLKQQFLSFIIAFIVLTGATAYATAEFVEPNTVNPLTGKEKEYMSINDYAKNAVIKGGVEGIKSEINGEDFSNGFKEGAYLSLISDSALQMRKYVAENFELIDKNKLAGSHRNPDGETQEAPFGGSQTGEGKLFGFKYEKGGLVDYVMESFAGPHDFLSSWNYKNKIVEGNKQTWLKNDDWSIDAISGLLLLPSLPLAGAAAIQDNLDFINELRRNIKLNQHKIEYFKNKDRSQ
jgi:filamentous hemagglutinin